MILTADIVSQTREEATQAGTNRSLPQLRFPVVLSPELVVFISRLTLATVETTLNAAKRPKDPTYHSVYE